MWEFFSKLLDTADFPARWYCGRWTAGHGWLYILSDVAIFAAYTAIPILLAYFVLRRRDAPFPRVFWLFVAFILACGATHLLDAVIFWHPVYRLSAVARLITALVSWATVFALVPVVPLALTLRTPQSLEAEVAARTAELLEAQQRLQEAHDSLERRVAARTAALQTSNEDLQQFAYIVAHDLQEPMRMVSSFTQLLQEELEDASASSEDIREYLHYARGGALRMQEHLRAVLAYSRVQSQGQPFQSFPLHAALTDATENLRLLLQESGAHLHASIPPSIVVYGDQHQLTQVFQNLLNNAIKYAHPDRPPEITLSITEDDSAWHISVQDNGIGFEMAHAERIFQIFQRLQPRSDTAGSGIGLAICRRIISRHGGRIGVTSTPASGSTFSFTLPFSPPPPL